VRDLETMAERKIRGTNNGLGESMGSLFVHYRGRLERFLANRSRRPHEANDLAQEVYLRLLRFPPGEVIQKPQAYLYRIASNVVHDFNLRAAQEPVTFDTDVTEELAEQAADVWAGDLGDRLIAEQELHRLLVQLPRGHLAALLLHMRDGMSYAEVAKALGIEINTAKKRIARAIAQCRAAERRRNYGGETHE
jgi:RNA polymerase sigma factor (sigma-70 family)